MKVAFICVNYNNSDVTIEYILNVLDIKHRYDVKIIIVDNDSEKEDVNNLDKYILNLKNQDVVLLKSDSNLGYFKGLNLGIKWALDLGYNNYQVVGNNDLKFHDDFLLKLEGINTDNDVLVIAPDIITNSGSHENPHVIAKMPFLRKLKYDIYYKSYYISKFISLFVSTDRRMKAYDPDKKIIHMGIGALYVLTPTFFTYFSQLWEDVFLYGEEAIFAGQVLSVNGKILYDPVLKCNHNESATTSKMPSKYKYKVVQKSYRKYRQYL
jgi:GT2 family glycosyltransferase